MKTITAAATENKAGAKPLPPSQPKNNDPFLDDAAAAAYLGFSKKTMPVIRCTGRYNIPYLKIGRIVKYRQSDLDAFIARKMVYPEHGE